MNNKLQISVIRIIILISGSDNENKKPPPEIHRKAAYQNLLMNRISYILLILKNNTINQTVCQQKQLDMRCFNAIYGLYRFKFRRKT